MRDERRVLALRAANLAAVVDEGAGEGGGEREEDEPVAGGKSGLKRGETFRRKVVSARGEAAV